MDKICFCFVMINLIFIINGLVINYCKDFCSYLLEDDGNKIKYVIFFICFFTISLFPYYCFFKIKQFLIKNNDNTICYNENGKLQFKKTFLNQNKIVKKINKELKYVDFTNKDFEKYFLIFNKNEFKKINNVNKYSFEYVIKDFLKENNIKLIDVKKLIEENNEKHEEILNNHVIKQNNQNDQLDKLCNAINNIKSYN